MNNFPVQKSFEEEDLELYPYIDKVELNKGSSMSQYMF